jgi:nicotinamidase-related amidase
MKRALLVIDVQNEYFAGGGLPVTYPAGSLDNILSAMDVAFRREVPVIVVRHTSPSAGSPVFRRGTDRWELHPAVAERPCSYLVDKQLPGSFTGTGLEIWLHENGIDTVTISGYMTQMCCDTTARQAFHKGFGVEFLSDATGTLAFKNGAGSVDAEELHRAVLVTQQSMFGRVMTTAEWMASLA